MEGQVGEPGSEPALVACAKDVLAGSRGLHDFGSVFARATIYGRRPAHPGVETVDVDGRGRWTFVFSTPQRLAAHAGDCDVYATTGADLLGQLPPGIGVMLDPDDRHRFAVLVGARRREEAG
ncbi:hypothetical protein M8542_14760 [Amycolatopsis sp. OK19-0408]|uniref:SseB protein N-terminal domain-containing protein n=1 Tax=Amycolatopsis iheyensis TaxID=2945988 RepID=A0A9X2NG93_9PSEU|nr:hypothetical protein [Amycolatopsis iheyensis]MCR6484080.1 hypothetical protein [Amycolatopsis iheyensis]